MPGNAGLNIKNSAKMKKIFYIITQNMAGKESRDRCRRCSSLIGNPFSLPAFCLLESDFCVAARNHAVHIHSLKSAGGVGNDDRAS